MLDAIEQAAGGFLANLVHYRDRELALIASAHEVAAIQKLPAVGIKAYAPFTQDRALLTQV